MTGRLIGAPKNEDPRIQRRQAAAPLPWLRTNAEEPPVEQGVVAAQGEPIVVDGREMVASEGMLFDAAEWVAGSGGGVVPRCQHGRFDPWVKPDGSPRQRKPAGQCVYPAARAMRTCMDHGGVPVAKQWLQAQTVPLIRAMVEIALDETEKTADRLRAMDSALDRTGGIGRTVSTPEPELRSSLLLRLEQAAQEFLDGKGDQGDAGLQPPGAPNGAPPEPVVAAHDGGRTPPELAPAPVAHTEPVPPADLPAWAQNPVVAAQEDPGP